jgi:limonene-1,2-epoxide hydrolase
MLTMSEAITGNEAITDMDDPYSALVEFYAAFNQGDMGIMAENWARNDDVAMSNPLGGIKRGWEEIAAVYRRIFEGPAKVYVEYYDYHIIENGGMFCAIGRERGSFTLGDHSLELAIRTSRIYRQEGRRWRQVHHHGSIDQPELLQRYQAAVLKGVVE